MLLDPDAENDVAYELCQIVGRAILPYSRGEDDRDGAGTAFFFRTGSGEYLLTADALTGATLGELGLRGSVTEPAGVAPDSVAVAGGATGWVCQPGSGVAILPTTGLHRQARDGGWAWRTQPVADVIAADGDVIGRIDATPGSAFVLAHGVREDGSRPLEVAIERVVRADDEVRITTTLPAGYVGAPVFGVQADADGALTLHCLGLVLPGTDGGHQVATFDEIRAALPPAGAGTD
ncbi:hypothetical protein [Micromonospora sp. WMMD812]|uniref:hypothetical protein n=1 Tax=Micromonospora sp. WMMD812 TaxID=3015152 RepID=UPI00248B7E6A|nr:hypothetical protein [Micromonospora sp. WMMD812]WBB66821.1 hypothetical protein O7603_27385 [Micromonospora sp. WMMD812]